MEDPGRDSDGAFLMFEDRMEQGKVTPLHIHPDTDETLVVLEGEILVHLDGTEQRVSEGGISSRPRPPPRLHGHVAVRATAVLADTRQHRVALLGRRDPIADDVDAGEVDFDRIAASGQRNGGIVQLGPPPFAH